MKSWFIAAGICLFSASAPAQAADTPDASAPGMGMGGMMMHGGMHGSMHGSRMGAGATTDERISLGLGPMQRQHQLANMRSHLAAVQDIVGLIAENRFDEASVVAHQKLGLTPEMQQMCSMFTDKGFRDMGLAFHRSADELGDTLKRGKLKPSLQALHRTMNYCIQCHATYRQ